jgi:hypothetical protein
MRILAATAGAPGAAVLIGWKVKLMARRASVIS